MGRWIMISGLVLVVLGAVLQFMPWLLNWFGRLPGDIHIKSGYGRIYVPITSMVILSLLLTLLLNLFRR